MNGEQAKKTSSIGLAFDRDAALAFLYKKSEKLASATYLVTNHIKDSDQMKWSLRSSALDLMSDIVSAAHPAVFEKGHARVIAGRFAEMSSLLEVASLSGVISRANSSVLKEELSSLASVLDRRVAEMESGSLMLPSEFFDVGSREAALPSVRPESTLGAAPSLGASGQGVAERTSASARASQDREPSVRSSDNATVHKGHASAFSIGQNARREALKKPRPNGHHEHGSSSDRRAAIVALLKSKKEVGVTDVASVIKGCGEKTIQRELLAMVKDGVLKKQGERRWSRYLLV